ncbi:MAG: TIGR04282 family arsenosugar biosynthesis glycosyltransferase [Bacteroidota bacterium]
MPTLPPSALLVFAKRPEPGRVKTRLTALLTPEEAADLYAAMLRDALDAYAALGCAVRLYLAPDADGHAPTLPDGWVPDGVTVHTQHGDGLGQRMLHAFVDAFRAGHERLVVIGTDHPTLPPAYIEMTFELLREKPLRVVLGPTHDGGYYLLGQNDLFPRLFEDMTYSHDGVFEATLRRAAEVTAEPVVLPTWYDVDTPVELRRLCRELDEGATVPPRTEVALAALRARYEDLR